MFYGAHFSYSRALYRESAAFLRSYHVMSLIHNIISCLARPCCCCCSFPCFSYNRGILGWAVWASGYDVCVLNRCTYLYNVHVNHMCTSHAHYAHTGNDIFFATHRKKYLKICLELNAQWLDGKWKRTEDTCEMMPLSLGSAGQQEGENACIDIVEDSLTASINIS